MKTLIKLWFGLLVLSFIFYYIPVALFSNNLEEAVKSQKIDDIAPLLAALIPGATEETLERAKHTQFPPDLFDSKATIWNALESNPNIQDLKFITTGQNDLPLFDPLYGNRDAEIAFKFKDGSGVGILFNVLDKGFGHGAKVFHIAQVFRETADGRAFGMSSEDSAAKLIAAIFSRDPKGLPAVYNSVFGAHVPVVDAPSPEHSSDPNDALKQQLINAMASDNSAPVASTSAPAPAEAQTPPPPSVASAASATQPPPPIQPSTALDSCVTGWVVAYHKEQGPDAPVSPDQTDEWQRWCAQGKQAP